MIGPSTRFMAGVLLSCGGRVLLLQRSMRKELDPGKYSFCGGHFEPDELRAPMRAALRELQEETGIRREQLASFGLRYVLLTTGGNELRVHFTYAAEITRELPVTPTDEGTWHWVGRREALRCDLGATPRVMLRDWLSHPDDGVVRMAVRRGEDADWLTTDALQTAGFRPAAGTIARCGGKLLLLRRAMDKEIAPGMWANIGGHMEGDEMRDPSATALREYGEETGIGVEELRGFAFSGAILLARPHEFGLIFGYKAYFDREVAVPDSEDGEFRWVREEDVETLPMTPAMKAVAMIDARNGPPKIGLARDEDIRLYDVPFGVG